MMHLTEHDFVLHYYGELAADDERRAAEHLAACAACRQSFTRLQRVLGAIDESAIAPELPESFERSVWARLEPNLARRDRRGWFSWLMLSPAPLALAATVLLLVGAAFFAGRLSSPPSEAPSEAANSNDMRERILLAAVGEHLDRSQMVLVELASAASAGPVDVSGERASAEQLLAANRLYRQSAASTGDTALGDLLDELERFLVEIAAGPKQLSSQELDGVQRQIVAKGLLFRVRVLSSEVRDRQRESIQRRASPSSTPGA